ncbi:MAG: 50S ribosomal protein L17 [Candidatus Omnitrophica bacterium]|nr:50S ribosomal protein L17 [bacterium]NUN95851.1 50S ribosomal protein L17 [Candidatus Omnitrophota bacterium]
MYHRMGERKLGRTTAHRRALLRNQATSLLRHGGIVTTVAKCKELRRFVEKLITLAKRDELSRRRLANRHLNDWGMVGYLFEEIGPRYVTRPGGYTRIVRLPERTRDAAAIARIELVED